MALRDRIEDWAVRELAEVKRAPVAVVIVFALGILAGWSFAKQFYAERIEVLQVQVAAGRVANPPTPVPSPVPPQVVLLPHVSQRAGIGIAVGIAVLIALVPVLAWRVRRLRADGSAKDDLLGVAARLNRHLTDERDLATAALKDKKHEYAMKVLERYAHLRFKDDVKPTVTVRFAGYGQDYELAQQIKGIFTQYVTWSVALDGSNKPALPRAEKFKVVFDVGMIGISYGDLVHAFSEGDLLGVPVGVFQFVDREDTEHLIVMVLPSAERERLEGKGAAG